MILCAILARGGSKSIPNKNLRFLGAKPLLSHTIDLAVTVPQFTTVCLSSDSDEILSLGQGTCEVLKRPDHIAGDTSPSEDAIIHMIEHYSSIGVNFEYVVLLEPTSPLRTYENVQEGLKTLLSDNSPSVVAVCKVNGNFGYVENNCFNLVQSQRRRQDRKQFFVETGVFYGAQVNHMLTKKTFVCDNWGVFEVSEKESLDINTLEDFEDAEKEIGNKW